MGAGVASLLGACTTSTSPPSSTTPASVAPATSLAGTANDSPAATAAGRTGRLLGYAFNAGGQDVTVFDVASRMVVETRPLGATVRWLSNEQRFWDGSSIWTFDHPENRVQAIAIDPRTLRVTRTVSTNGKGPAHSLMLTPDKKTAWLNVAGDDFLAVIDVGSGEMAGQVKTGKFP